MSNLFDNWVAYKGNQGPALPPSKPAQAVEQPTFDEWDYKTSETNYEGEALPNGALGWRPDGTPDFGTGFTGWWKKAYFNVQDAYFKGWNQGDVIAQEKQYETDWMPRFTSSVEATKAIGGELLWGGLGALGKLAEWTEQIGGTVGYALKDVIYEGKTFDQINWNENWQASQLAYNSIFGWDKDKGLYFRQGDEIREEFVERMSAGERPDMIVEDMLINGKANPWIEMAGELIFDPLNVDLFVNWFGKGRKSLVVAKAQMKAFATIENPVVREVIEQGGKMSDEFAASVKFKEAVIAQQATRKAAAEMVDVLRKPGAVVTKGLPKRTAQYARYVPESRKLALSNRMGEITTDIVRQARGEADEVLDIFDAMVRSGSDDTAEAGQGLAKILKTQNPAHLLSEAGNELGAVLETMLKRSPKWLDELADASKLGQQAVSDLLLKRLDGAMDELFPSAIDMVKAGDEVAQLAKEGKDIPEALGRMAELGKRLSPVERAVARAHNSAQKGVVGTLNRAFAQVYMNLSPAFAFRNGLQNNLQVFLDYGPAAYMRTADGWMDEAARLNKVAVPGSTGFGAASDAAGQAAYKVEKTGYLGLVESLKAAFKGKGFRASSEVMETNAAQRIVGSQYVKTFREGLQPMVDGLRKDARFKAISQDLWEVVQSDVYNNYGEVKKG